MNTILKDFDLPQKFLDGDADHVTRKARDPDEIARRQQLPPNVLIYEQQHIGLTIAKNMLELVEEPEDITYTAETLAVGAMNTAWYLLARNAPQMRKRLKLEMLAAAEPEQRPSTLMLLDNATHDLNRMNPVSTKLIWAAKYNQREVHEPRVKLGRMIGHTSLTLACVPIGDRIGYDDLELSNADLQFMARDRGLYVLQKGRTMSKEIGTAPSIAQLADRDSDLSVYWRRTAPDGALRALEEATAA